MSTHEVIDVPEWGKSPTMTIASAPAVATSKTSQASLRFRPVFEFELSDLMFPLRRHH